MRIDVLVVVVSVRARALSNTRMQQTAWRVIRCLPRRCRGDPTELRGLSQSGFCWHGPQLIRMLCASADCANATQRSSTRRRFAASSSSRLTRSTRLGDNGLVNQPKESVARHLSRQTGVGPGQRRRPPVAAHSVYSTRATEPGRWCIPSRGAIARAGPSLEKRPAQDLGANAFGKVVDTQASDHYALTAEERTREMEGSEVTPNEARQLLEAGRDCEEPVFLPPQVLEHLTFQDIPKDVQVQVGVAKDGVHYLEWDGFLCVDNGNPSAIGEYILTRKYWEGPLGLPQYLDLVRRAIEARAVTRSDVTLITHEDDGAFIHLSYRFVVPAGNLRDAHAYAVAFQRQLEEAADDTSAQVGKLVAAVAQRVSGYGAHTLDKLIEFVETAGTSDEKGRALEELSARLFETLPGLSVRSRVRTASEEIDLQVLNDSSDPRLRREEALILAECKNWSGKCGKDELVLFRQKVENRHDRCSLGFLISWRGFATTVTREMLRGSRERILVVPVDGPAIRTAVRDGEATRVLLEAWTKAVDL